MFNKIKAKIDKFIINFMYGFKVGFYANGAKYQDKSFEILSKILTRSNKYIMNGEQTMDIKISCKGDETGKEYPVWIEHITDEELLFLGKYIPVLYELGIISPIVCPVINNLNHTLAGFLILIPLSFCNDVKVGQFCVGHEISHIANGDFVGEDIFSEKINTSIEKECAADIASFVSMKISIKECTMLLYDTFKNSYITTIKTIPALSKKWNRNAEKMEKDVENILKYDKNLQTRMTFLSLASSEN
jgi:hypothetical protein